MAYIEFKNVFKQYKETGEIKALKKVSLKIDQGEIVVIKGPSGSGKTTLLNMLGAIDKPTSGEVMVDGVLLNELKGKNLKDYRKNQVGFVFQNCNLIETLTVKENVLVASLICDDAQDVDQLMRKFSLSKKINDFLDNLSRSERKKVSIARAIVKNPKILLCDEIFNELDEKSVKQVLKLIISNVKNKKMTVILTTHNDEFTDFANKVITIKNGVIESIKKNKEPKTAGDLKC